MWPGICQKYHLLFCASVMCLVAPHQECHIPYRHKSKYTVIHNNQGCCFIYSVLLCWSSQYVESILNVKSSVQTDKVMAQIHTEALSEIVWEFAYWMWLSGKFCSNYNSNASPIRSNYEEQNGMVIKQRRNPAKTDSALVLYCTFI